MQHGPLSESMLWCSGPWAEELKARLNDVGRALDRRGVPDHVPEALVLEAAARSGRYETFRGAGGGLGVRGLPPGRRSKHSRNPLPSVFLDVFYLDLAALILERM